MIDASLRRTLSEGAARGIHEETEEDEDLLDTLRERVRWKARRALYGFNSVIADPAWQTLVRRTRAGCVVPAYRATTRDPLCDARALYAASHRRCFVWP